MMKVIFTAAAGGRREYKSDEERSANLNQLGSFRMQNSLASIVFSHTSLETTAAFSRAACFSLWLVCPSSLPIFTLHSLSL